MFPAARLARLEALSTEPNDLRKKLVALGILGDRLAEEGIEPILVGGSALAVYTAGGYSTRDVDLALPISPFVDAAFAELGFRKEGRYWVRPELDLFFEAPAPAGLPGEEAQRLEIEADGLRVVVIGLEDLLLDRLRAWVHWKSDEDGRWAARLVGLWAERLDRAYLRRKATEAGEAAALERLLGEETGP